MTRVALYKVNPGDKLESVAERFGLRSDQVALHNDKDLGSQIESGEILDIPVEDKPVHWVNVQDEIAKFSVINKKLTSDKTFRAAFLADPSGELSKEGIYMPADLLPDDFPVLRLLDDEAFQEVKRTGNSEDVRTYIQEHYPDLVSHDVYAQTLPVVAPLVVVALVVAPA